MAYQNAADILPEDYLTEKRQANNMAHSPQTQFHDTYNDTSDGDDSWSDSEFDTDEEDHVHENGTVNGYHHDELEGEGIYDAPEQNNDLKGPPPVSRLSKPKPVGQKVAPVTTSHTANPAFQVNTSTKQKQFKQFNAPAKLNSNLITSKPEPPNKPSASSPSEPNSFPKRPPIISQKPKPNLHVLPKPHIKSPGKPVIENLEIYEDPDNADQREDADSFYEMPDNESEPNQHTFQNKKEGRRSPAPHSNSNLNQPKMSAGMFMEKLHSMKQKTFDLTKKNDKKTMEIKPKPNYPTNNNIQNMNTDIKKRPAMPLPYHNGNTNNTNKGSNESPAKDQTSSVKGRPPCPLPTTAEHQTSLSPRPPPIGERKIEEVVEDGDKEYSYAYPDPLPNFDRSNFEKKKDEKAGIYQPQNFVSVPTMSKGSRSNISSYVAPNISLPSQFKGPAPPKAPERLSDPKPLITPPVVNKPAPKTKQQPMPPKILQELRQQKPNIGTSANRAPAELAPNRPSALGQRVSPIGQENDSRNSGRSLNTQQQQQPPNQRFNNRPTQQIPDLKPLPDMFQSGRKLEPGSFKSPIPVGRSSREEKSVEKSSAHLQGYPWYQGDITIRGQAEDRLRGKPEGSFIIRPTNKGEGYSISLCHKGVVTHLRVPLKDGYYYLGTSEKKYLRWWTNIRNIQNFTTVPELVSFYQKNAVVLQSGGKVILRK